MDDYGLQNAYLNFAGNLVSSAMNYAAASSIDKQTRKYNTRMYEKQLADNRENWRMSNEYNSPVQQVQRLKEAGLNPNLVYGSKTAQGNTSGPAAGASPQAWNRHVPNADFGNFGSDLMAGMLQKYQIDAIKAQVEKTNAEKARIIADTPGVDAASKQKVFDYMMTEAYGEQRYQTELELLMNKLELGQNEVVMKSNERVISDWFVEHTDLWQTMKTFEAMLPQARYDEIEARIAKVPFEIASLVAGVEESKARRSLMRTQEDLNEIRGWLMTKEGMVKDNELTKQSLQVTQMEREMELWDTEQGWYKDNPGYTNFLRRVSDITSTIGEILGGVSKLRSLKKK